MTSRILLKEKSDRCTMTDLWLWAFMAMILTPLHAFSPDPSVALDVAIVIDRTRSIGGNNYKRMLTSVEKFIGKFDVGENTTHFAIVTFASYAEIRVNFTDTKYYSLEAWRQLIQEMKKTDKLGAPTRTDRALRMVCENVFVPENGDRPESPNVLILLTDGNTHKASEPFDTAIQGCKVTNIHRVAVGIGPNINQLELEAITGDKNKVIMVDSFKSLHKHLENISQIANVPLSFASRPTNQTVIEGTNTTFHCTATGNPTPTITWMKDGKFVAEGHTLSFETSRNDSGKYWCLATNGLGDTINTTVNLDVQYSPSIILKPEDKIVTEGKLLTFQCAAAGNPSPKITWTKDGITMAEGDALSFKTNRTQSGKYWCSAENGVKSAVNASANLDVQFPPSFDSRPTNKTVIEGTNTTFHCTATGNPTPTITWMKDGKSVAEGHTFSFETSWNDSGKYWCLATNGLGETINTTVNLDVQYPPSIILKPPDKIVAEGDMLTFQCAATGNPTPKMTWTKDGKTVAEGDTLSFRTNRTQSGKYWCSAENGVKPSVNASADLDVQSPATSPPKPCKEHLDIAVIIDSSDRISPAGYDLVRQYLIRLADRLQISGAGTHMAILLYSWEAHTWHRFSDNQTISAVKSKANSLPHSRGGSRTDRALELAAQDLFGWEDSGDRPDKPNVLIVLTHGTTYEGNKPLARVVPPLDEAKVRRIAVGAGYGFREHELGKIASNSSYVLKVFGVNEMFSKLENVINLACDEQDIGDCSEWGSYGACSKTCGGGVQVRTRTCPENSLNLRKQKKHCNDELCPGQKLCEDKEENCPIRAASGDCWKTAQPSDTFYVGKRFPLWDICPKSCRRCHVDPCQDSDPYVCPWWSQARENKRKCRFIFPSGGRIATLKEMCQRSCRQCPATGDCKDAFPRCYSFVRLRGCRHRRVKQNCPKSCGLCGGGSPAGDFGNDNVWPNIHGNRHPGNVVHGKVYPWGR
nr:uncharacterized protein LOC131779909 isoform X2 [Pocillopora verrucosa]